MAWAGFSGDATLKICYSASQQGIPTVPETAIYRSIQYFGKVRQVIGFVGFYFWKLILAILRVAYDVITPRLEYLTDAAIWPAPARLRRKFKATTQIEAIANSSGMNGSVQGISSRDETTI